MTYSNEQREPYSWLTEQSRKFLNNGYLVDGQSAESRIFDIAITAESILKKEGFAEKFIDYMSKG